MYSGTEFINKTKSPMDLPISFTVSFLLVPTGLVRATPYYKHIFCAKLIKHLFVKRVKYALSFHL